MIVLINNEGQMCNRIKEFAHCIAHAIEVKKPVKNYVWGELDQYFEHESCSVDIEVVTNRRCANIIGYVAKIWGCVWGKRNYKFFFRNKEIEIINNPEFYDWDALFAHKEEVLRYLNFADKYKKCAQRKIETIQTEEQSILVGVHIRRGDYKTWRGGKYFFTDEEYRSFFQQIATKMKNNVKFVVCSNDIYLKKENLMGFNYSVDISVCDSVTDLLILSKCDYIIAPPSTYSWWAAFIGNCYYLTLVDKNMNIDLSEFEHIGDRFMAGERQYELYKGL